MRKVICWILGIRDLKPQLSDLQKTIDSMADQLTQMQSTYNTALEIIKLWEKSDEQKPWYKDEELLRDTDCETRALAYRIEEGEKRKIVYSHPSLKQHIIFHGGCLGCSTSLREGIGSCKGCYYFNNINSSFPDLSKKYQKEHSV